MTWYAVTSVHDEAVAGDLRAASVGVFRPTYQHEYWDGRKSVRVSRTCSLLPGYLLLDTPSVSRQATRHSFRFMLDHTSGLPLRVGDAELLMSRCLRGEFDVVAGKDERRFSPGDLVLVSVLDLVGEVVSVTRRTCQVLLAVSKRLVTVPRAGLALA